MRGFRPSGSWKVLPVLGGIVAVIGFFLAFLEIRAPGGWPMSVSAFDVVSGEVSVARLAEALPEGTVATPDQRDALKRFDDLGKDYGAAMLVLYVPAVIQLLVGLVGLFGRFGRGKGLFVIVLGLVSVGIAYMFWSVQPDPATGVKLGWGCIALAVAGAAGIAGGLFALILPDRD